MDKQEIARARGRLEKERREETDRLMEEYDRQYYIKLNALKDLCGQTEHVWRFSHFGPLGHLWYYCSYCGKSKVENDS